jgi:glycosyl transferase, family 25
MTDEINEDISYIRNWFDTSEYGTTLIIAFILFFIVLVIYKRTDGFMNYFEKEHINFKDIDSYYINLDRSVKRRNEFERQCVDQDLSVQRFSAVDGQKIPDEMVKEVLHHPNSEHFLNSVLIDDRKNIGHFGCFLSHIGVYHKFMESDKPYCLIFEDDAEFKTDTFKADVNRHMGNVPKDWDIVLFGFHTADDLHHDKNQDTFLKDNIFHNLEHWTGLQGYMINKKSCQQLLEKLAHPSWYIDWEISDLTKAGDFKVYGVFEPLVCQPACYTMKFDNKHMLMNHIQNCKWGGGMATTFSE